MSPKRTRDAAPLWQEAPVARSGKCCVSAMPKRSAASLRNSRDPFREAIVLREINDLSYSEIADVVGVPVGTVMSRLARAPRSSCSGRHG
jgi:RNA polymerase sigma-70 factor (ECF subfamily)